MPLYLYNFIDNDITKVMQKLINYLQNHINTCMLKKTIQTYYESYQFAIYTCPLGHVNTHKNFGASTITQN